MTSIILIFECGMKHHNFDPIFMFMLLQLCASLKLPAPNTLFGCLRDGPLISCETMLWSE